MDLHGTKISRICSRLEISRICSETEKISRVYPDPCPFKPLASDQMTARALCARTRASERARHLVARASDQLCAEHEEVYSRL